MSHVTFSCDAAWIASYSVGATTPTKLPRRTTWAPGMLLIELSSTLRTVKLAGPPLGPVPRRFAAPRGRTGRPWSMPGTRTFWMYVYFPETLSGMSIRGTRVPTTL